MRIPAIIVSFLMCSFLQATVVPAAVESPGVLEQSMSDTLDLWREGRYEQLYDHLAHRGKTSREQFAIKMRDTAIRPACCFEKKMNIWPPGVRHDEATVYAKVGLEGTPNAAESSTREFKLTHEENIWKMQLADVLTISGASGRKKGRTYNKSTPYK